MNNPAPEPKVVAWPVDHIGISVGNLDAMLDWYSGTFNMRVTHAFCVAEQGLRGAFLISSTGLALELLERCGSVDPGPAADQPASLLRRGYGHICLRVDDVDAQHARLVAAGGMERMSPRTSPEAGVRMSFVADPEGNFIELINRKVAIQ